MTFMVMDVRELTFDEVEYVSGGFNLWEAAKGVVAVAVGVAVRSTPAAMLVAFVLSGVELDDVKNARVSPSVFHP